MRPETSETAGAGGLDQWEDAAPSRAVALATESAPTSAGDRISTIYAVAELMREGYNMTEAAAVLSLPYSEVDRAMRDPRAAVIKRRLAAEQTGSSILAGAQARYRLDRAWEVVTAALDDPDKWARLQAANMIISADRAAKDKGPQKIEIIMSPAMCFDDQNLQDDDDDDAERADSDQMEAHERAEGSE